MVYGRATHNTGADLLDAYAIPRTDMSSADYY